MWFFTHIIPHWMAFLLVVLLFLFTFNFWQLFSVYFPFFLLFVLLFDPPFSPFNAPSASRSAFSSHSHCSGRVIIIIRLRRSNRYSNLIYIFFSSLVFLVVVVFVRCHIPFSLLICILLLGIVRCISGLFNLNVFYILCVYSVNSLFLLLMFLALCLVVPIKCHHSEIWSFPLHLTHTVAHSYAQVISTHQRYM